MFVGVPKELKECEGRVGLDPRRVAILSERGHQVLIQYGAGASSGFSDYDYNMAGGLPCSQKDVWEYAELIVKVKEPLPTEYRFFRKDLKIMTFFHFPANPALKEKCDRYGVNPIPYEYIKTPDGQKPILKAMSIVAGEIAADMAPQYLRKESDGKGILMSDATVSIIGVWGNVGYRAFSILRHRAKKIFGLDNRSFYDSSCLDMDFLFSTPETIAKIVSQSDVVIGAAVNKDGGAPHLITREMIRNMDPGSVLIDVAIDEGGISETSRPTTYNNPFYVEEGVVHVCVANLPGGVPRASSARLIDQSFPYILKVASGENVL